MPTYQPARKPSACLPCHERKIRCDSVHVGVPCSKCISKDRTHDCVLLERSSKKRNREAADHQQSQGAQIRRAFKNSTDPAIEAPSAAARHTPLSLLSEGIPEDTPEDILEDSTLVIGTTSNRRNLTPVSSHVHANDATSARETGHGSTTVPLEQLLGQTTRPSGSPFTVSEEDAHLQTLCRMSGEDRYMSHPTTFANSDRDSHIVEYYGKLNSITVLGEVLGKQQPRRLVRIELPGPNTMSAKQRELSGLEPDDIAYLNGKRIHELPSKSACDAFLSLFFDYVYPYTPILDRVQLLHDYQRDNCSSFLLYSLLANVIPYASSELVQEAGYMDRAAAQKAFVSRATLLYDFGCEKSQLVLLQGSVLLSSFQFSFAPSKDFRFWFHNSVRIATQMGLHRENLREDLDPAIHSLCKRIWWLLFQRDIVFSISGFENIRRICDSDVDTRPLSLDDWDNEPLTEQAQDILSPITQVHKHFFIENCKLARIVAKFLELFRFTHLPSLLSTAYELAEDISSWRSTLPEELLITKVTRWSSRNFWIIHLLSMSYRYECVFYRWIRGRARGLDEDALAWSQKQLHSSIFELDTLIRRAVIQEVAHLCPPSLIISASVLLAFQVELALDSDSTHPLRISAKSQIQAGLSYLRDIKARWQMAEWSLRLFEWVVKSTHLCVTDGNDYTTQRMSFDISQLTTHPDSTEQSVYPDHGSRSQQVMEEVPDYWMQVFLEESLAGQLNNDLFNM